MKYTGRGVWLAPFMGEHGEFVLVAITSERKRLAECVVPMGADRVSFFESLCRLLDQHDPVAPANAAPPRWQRMETAVAT